MRPNLSTLQALAVATQFGFTLAVAVGLGILLGSFLDARLGTGVLFLLLGVLAGLASAVIGTVQLMNFIQRRQTAARENERRD
ncbi:MAG: AtpZ/AtpI family protein [Chloroflexi bacterium]|nr:AtpZ/AtpI family protein [Chloroflexota bacterium]